MTKASDGLTGVIWSNDAFAESEDDDGARCRHLNPVIRQRTRRNGSAAFIFQCDDCGEVLSEPVRRAVAEREAGERGITPFDEAALEALRAEQKAARMDESEARAVAAREAYQAYLKSPEWRRRRDLVMKRCNGVCEGCAAAPAVEVHHLTYEHVQNEFLWELVGVCKACHDRVHDDSSAR